MTENIARRKFRAHHKPLGWSRPFGFGQAPVWEDFKGDLQHVSYWTELCKIVFEEEVSDD